MTDSAAFSPIDELDELFRHNTLTTFLDNEKPFSLSWDSSRFRLQIEVRYPADQEVSVGFQLIDKEESLSNEDNVRSVALVRSGIDEEVDSLLGDLITGITLSLIQECSYYFTLP
jgi:hypothetical protein